MKRQVGSNFEDVDAVGAVVEAVSVCDAI